MGKEDSNTTKAEALYVVESYSTQVKIRSKMRQVSRHQKKVGIILEGIKRYFKSSVYYGLVVRFR